MQLASGVSMFSTGVPNLDELLGGGLPANTLNILAGEPGTGKTILAQQALFHHVRENPQARVLYLTTLSEPAMKVIRYLQGFSFYDADAFGIRVVYRDVGGYLREKPTNELLEEIMRLVEETQPSILCIDSFKAIRDLMPAQEEFRRFCYDLSVRLASAACTTLLLGEYESSETAQGAEFAVADGIIQLRKGMRNGEPARMITIKKMRGQPMNMGEFAFGITREGIHVYTPALTLSHVPEAREESVSRARTGVEGLDELLNGGLPRGRSVMVSGVSGSGKTTLGLQFIIRGAEMGETGLIYTYEETPDRLLSLARGFGWDLQRHVDAGTVRILHTPMPDIRVDEALESMVANVAEMRPRRIIVDSFSMFLDKVNDDSRKRETAYQMASLVQRSGAVALLISDIPSHESNRVSRFGVEDTVVDGTIVLSTELRSGKRLRFIEVYKMRSTDHVRGRHRMDISETGLQVFYKSPLSRAGIEAPPPISYSPLDTIMEGDVPYEHSWLVRGGPGAGKSVWAIQFAVERMRSGEAVLFVTTEASSRTVLSAMERLGLLTEPYLESGQLVVKSVEESPELDLEDPDGFITTISRWVEQMPKPCARIVDSLSPVLVGMSPEDFKAMLNKRKSLSSRPDVSLFDTVMAADDALQPFLTNHFDVVVDLYTPDWGDMRGADDRGRPVMRVVKARGVRVDTRPYPFRVSKEGGVVVQKDFYGVRG
ncbi:MAG TPA: ATPase domain-containing protein [Candidatus Thermoplasmatota archaeon]|nr:ATPase domain-containing protein [Candidatus Thermoplasmatota archaeon]